MNEMNQIRSFFSDLITPIVMEAVAEAIPESIKNMDQIYIPVQQIPEKYGISVSKIYLMFTSGELQKIKQGAHTFVSIAELESLMKAEQLCGKKPYKRR